VAWRAERLADAAVLSESPFLAQAVARFMADPRSEVAEELRRRFRSLQNQYHYTDVLLVDPEGQVRLGLTENSDGHRADTASLTAALRDRKPVFIDLHISETDARPCLDVVAPLFAGNGQAQTPLGAIILVSDARKFLYPIIQSWPTPSETAETLLVRRDGDDVLFLNDVRHRPGTALEFRIPLSATEVIAVMAVLGREGVVQGNDYRGVEVVSVLEPVPDSPWFMVAKVDTTEAFADWRSRAGLILALLASMLTMAGVFGLVLWQRNEKAHYLSQLQAQAALRETQERLHTILEITKTGIDVIDPEFNLHYVDPGWQKAYGDPTGRKCYEYFMGRDTPCETCGIPRALETRQITVTEETLPREGNRVIEVRTVPFQDEQGQWLVSEINIDITERRRAEEEVRKAHQELFEQQRSETERVQIQLAKAREKLVTQTRLATIGQVAASIAHELRNPLGAVRNAAYYLKRHTSAENPKIPEYLSIIDQEIGAADSIIGDMMEMVRSKEPIKESVDLGRTFREVLDRICPKGEIRCDLSVDPDPFIVHADAGQLRQILGNLLTNAVQAMGGPGEITLNARRSIDYDVITVQDSGLGIAAEHRDLVFEPLFTTKAKGTGLGLTICRQIVERHGGTIDLLNREGRGAAFSLRLPRCVVPCAVQFTKGVT
jgi:PAS domain S-box-containing protein